MRKEVNATTDPRDELLVTRGHSMTVLGTTKFPAEIAKSNERHISTNVLHCILGDTLYIDGGQYYSNVFYGSVYDQSNFAEKDWVQSVLYNLISLDILKNVVMLISTIVHLQATTSSRSI